MKTTGMVRRVDSLGRIVIPKEIRKVLKIKENEQVEINVSGEEIILNRYSELDDNSLFLKNLINIICDIYKIDVLLTNLNKIKITNNNYSSFENKEMSLYLSNILQERKEVLENKKTDIHLTDDTDELSKSYFIKTLIINGDSIGLLIFLSDEDYFNFDDKLIELVTKYLENYLE